ncbi:hypothetical protein SEEK9263_04765 [Salmonella enterica subsp. enterica serovar Kentucky str. ATCC 9263]|nr:hypothetical protein SEEK9263_04765 [Salmonella enterica subsp. enterica serovar Kentucky str. ATCC 9263]
MNQDFSHPDQILSIFQIMIQDGGFLSLMFIYVAEITNQLTVLLKLFLIIVEFIQ